MYVEASFPATQGYSATLQTDRDLRGLFCLSFYVHRRVNTGSTAPTLTIETVNENGSVFVTSFDKRDDAWKKESIQIATTQYVEVRLRILVVWARLVVLNLFGLRNHVSISNLFRLRTGKISK